MLINPFLITFLLTSATSYQLPLQLDTLNARRSNINLKIFPKLLEFVTEQAIIAVNDQVYEIPLPDSEFTQFIDGLGKVDFLLENTVITYINASQYLSFTKMKEDKIYVALNEVTFSLETNMKYRQQPFPNWQGIKMTVLLINKVMDM